MTKGNNLRVLMAQVAIPAMVNRQQQADHVANMIAKLDAQLANQIVDLVLLPELSCMQYGTDNFKKLSEFAQPLDGSICTQMAALCRKHCVAMCFGMAREDSGDYYISQIVLDTQGQYLCHYDKVHTAQYGDSSEASNFRRGNHLASFELGGVKFGLAICYDLRFPELFRRYGQACRVDVMLHPVAFARDMTFATWHPFVITRALENQIYFLSLNQAGDYFGESIVCPPWVDEGRQPLIMDCEEGFQVVEIDVQELQKVRAAIPYGKDALVDYGNLLVQ